MRAKFATVLTCKHIILYDLPPLSASQASREHLTSSISCHFKQTYKDKNKWTLTKEKLYSDAYIKQSHTICCVGCMYKMCQGLRSTSKLRMEIYSVLCDTFGLKRTSLSRMSLTISARTVWHKTHTRSRQYYHNAYKKSRKFNTRLLSICFSSICGAFARRSVNLFIRWAYIRPHPPTFEAATGISDRGMSLQLSRSVATNV